MSRHCSIIHCNDLCERMVETTHLTTIYAKLLHKPIPVVQDPVTEVRDIAL